MESKCLPINLSSFANFIPMLKDLLIYKFKIDIKLKNGSLEICGSKDVISHCKKIINYYENADCQYLLKVNNYSINALKINDLIWLFESKCKCLLSLENSMLHIFGYKSNVSLLNNYILKFDRLVGNESFKILFSEGEITQLQLVCSQCNIRLPKQIEERSRIFVYNMLMARDSLFDEIALNDLDTDFEIDFNDDNLKYEGASSSNDIYHFSYPIIKKPSNCPTVDRNLKEDRTIDIKNKKSELRTIIIDGNNLAFGHGGDKFSCMGIKLAIDYFVNRGHKKIYAMLPRHRQSLGGPLFDKLERENQLKYTPSRRLNNVRETPYDDRFILDAAVATGGVVLSNDQYRDLMCVEKYTEIICNRLIPYTFIEDHLIIPDDPRGHNGPSLGIMLANPSQIIFQRSPKKQSQSHKKSQTPTNTLTKPTQVKLQEARSQSQPEDLKGRHLEFFNQINDIIPNESKLVREVILGNPNVSDANTIINLVLMALSNKK